MSANWKRPKAECPYFISGGYKYFLDQDIKNGWMWYCARVLNKPIEKKKRDTFRQIYIDLAGKPAGIEDNEIYINGSEAEREQQYKDWLRANTEGCSRLWEDNLRTWIRVISESEDGKPHYFAVDLSDKEWWEYYQDERMTGLFSTEKEAKEAAEYFWEKDNGRQMSLFE